MPYIKADTLSIGCRVDRRVYEWIQTQALDAGVKPTEWLEFYLTEGMHRKRVVMPKHWKKRQQLARVFEEPANDSDE